MSDILTAEQAADYLKVTIQTLAAWRYRRTGPPFMKLGKRAVRYRRADLEAFLTQVAANG